jgi:hypothetical protein
MPKHETTFLVGTQPAAAVLGPLDPFVLAVEGKVVIRQRPLNSWVMTFGKRSAAEKAQARVREQLSDVEVVSYQK